MPSINSGPASSSNVNLTAQLTTPVAAAQTTYTFATLPTTNISTGTTLYTSDQGLCVWDGTSWQTVVVPTPASYINRIPSLTDNAALGYSTSSIWQQAGTIYQPTAYCGTDSAAWAELTASAVGTPTDVMGTTVTKFAGGTCSMLKGFTGAAIDVAITIGGVYQIFTVNILATGELDNVYMGALMAQADASTYAKVLKIYDQTGNGNHCALGTATGVPCVANATVTTSTTLTINSQTSGTIAVGQIVYGNGIPPGITIASGTGPYTLSGTGAPSNPGPEAMYFGITSAPYIDWEPLLGRYTIQSPSEYTQNSTTNTRSLQFPQTMTITNANNFGVYTVGTAVSTADNNAPVLVSVGDNAISPNHSETIVGTGAILLAGQATSGQFGLADNGNLRIAPTVKVTQPMVLLMWTASSGNTITAYVNEQLGQQTVAITSQTLAGGWLFSKNGSGLTPYGMMKVVGMAIFNAAPTAAQATQMRNAAYARFNIFPQVRNLIALVGDSRIAGHNVSPGFGLSEFIPRIMGRNWDVVNIAVSSLQVTTMIGDGLVPTVTGYAKSLQTIKRTGLNYAIVLAGINDFIIGAKTVAQVLGYLQTLIAQINAVGWQVILMSELTTTTVTNNANTLTPQLNAAIQAAGTTGMGCAAIVNLYNYTPIVTPGNTNYYYDGLHPTAGVHNLIAGAVTTALNSVVSAAL